MKRTLTAFFILLALSGLTAQEDLTPEQKYLRTRLNPQGTGAGISMEYAVTGSASLDYGLQFDDGVDDFAQGFETVIDSSLDITFTFRPDSFTASPRQSYMRRGIYAEIILTDFGVTIGNDAGVNFWDNYRIIDNEGNIYVPSQTNDNTIVDTATTNTEGELTYDSTIFYSGVQVTAPTVEANIHLTPEVYFQIASQPQLDHNLSTTLGGQGEWAGAATENSGGFSFILDYPRLNMRASLVSQNYYETEGQADEFGSTLTASYELSDNLVLQGYGGYINYYTAANSDNFYFATGREGSTASALALGGAALTYNFYELAEFGLSGDFAYVVNGKYNKGDTTIPKIVNFNGFLYDVRLDLPFPIALDKGVIALSADTYNYSYRDSIFTSDEKNTEFPLDLQLTFTYTEDRWQLQGAVQAFNILDFTNSYENYLLDDQQELAFLVSGQYTFGNPSRLAVTPGIDMIYSLGRLMPGGWYYSSVNDPGTYVTDWKDDYLSLQASIALEFPQTVMTISYASLQLLPGQGNSPAGSDYTGIDLGVMNISTVISY
ncbi:MAG: hypothetical protein JXA95_12100 [Spirochaetales bacterium]|nr:hypothetical protein [Spirochaetales bacterium]